MATDDFSTDEGENESGSSLRQKLEAALAENRSLKEQTIAMKAERLIQEKGYSLVKADDLKGVKQEELEAKAAEIQQAKLAEQRTLLRDVLGRKYGVEGEDLDSIVADHLGDESGESDGSYERLTTSARISGSPAPAVNTEKLHGFDAIVHALDKPAKRAK